MQQKPGQIVASPGGPRFGLIGFGAPAAGTSPISFVAMYGPLVVAVERLVLQRRRQAYQAAGQFLP